MPWMPAPSKMPSQRAFSGFCRRAAGDDLRRLGRSGTQSELGIVQAGFTALFWMW